MWSCWGGVVSLPHPTRLYLVAHDRPERLRLTATRDLGKAIAARSQALIAGGEVRMFYSDTCPDADALYLAYRAGSLLPYIEPKRETDDASS